MKKSLFPIVFLCFAALAGAGGCQSVTPPQPYVTADRQTKTATEHYLNQTKLDHPDWAEGINDLLASWELRVKNAESGVWPQ